MGHHLPSLRNWQSCSVEEIGQHSTFQGARLSVRLAFSVPPFHHSQFHSSTVAAGEKSLISLYCWKPGIKPWKLRYQRYCEKLTTSQPKGVPSRSETMKRWRRRHVSGTVGIKVSDDQVLHVMTDLLVVLECLILSYLLRMISFYLSSDCACAKCTYSPIQFNFI